MRNFTLWATLTSCVGTPQNQSNLPADSGPTDQTVTIRFLRWVVEAECWGTVDLEKDATVWALWAQPTQECPRQEDSLPEHPYFNYGAVDGGCFSMQTGLQGEIEGWDHCAVDDPWILPCEESDVPDCCTLAGGVCFPDPYYPETGT